MSNQRVRVLFDRQAFMSRGHGGVNRMFAELISQYRSGNYSVEPITPYRWTFSEHLAASEPSRFRGPNALLPTRRRMRLANLPYELTAKRPDIVHHTYLTHEVKELRPGTRRISTIFDMIPEIYPDIVPGMNAHGAKAAYVAASDAVVCISAATRTDLLQRLGDPGVPVVVTHLGADPRFGVPGPRLADVPGPYVLYVGNRAWYKNFALGLGAFTRVAQSHPDLRLVCVGGGPFTPDESAEIASAGLASRVIQRDAVDGDLPALYQHASALLITSRVEGFGLPLTEAMAAGCPVLASDIAVFREIGADAVLYAGVDETDAMAAQLSRVLQDSTFREKVIEAGRLRARDFTWANTARQTEAVYQLIR